MHSVPRHMSRGSPYCTIFFQLQSSDGDFQKAKWDPYFLNLINLSRKFEFGVKKLINKYLCWDCAQTSVKNSRVHAQKILHVLHIVGKTEQELRLFSPGGVNGIVLNRLKRRGKVPRSSCKDFQQRKTQASR